MEGVCSLLGSDRVPQTQGTGQILLKLVLTHLPALMELSPWKQPFQAIKRVTLGRDLPPSKTAKPQLSHAVQMTSSLLHEAGVHTGGLGTCEDG